MKLHFNIKSLIATLHNMSLGWKTLSNNTQTASLAFAIMVVSVTGTSIFVNNLVLNNTIESLKLTKVQQVMERERFVHEETMVNDQYLAEFTKIQYKLAHDERVADEIRKNELTKLEYQLKIAETRAAINPYTPKLEQGAQPINVYINGDNTGYILKTKSGETNISISTITVNNTTYSPEQRKLMTMAYYIGEEFGFPETIQSLLLQETRAGSFGDRIGDTNLTIGKRSYGVMQMKVATAKKVLKRNKDMTLKYFPKRRTYKRLRDEEIIIKLIQDDEFNIRLAAMNFVIHRNASQSWAQAVVAYNTGQRKANTIKEPVKHVYYKHIMKRLLKEVRPFNQETNMSL